MTQDVIEGYVYAWVKGDSFAEMYIAKHAQGDPIRMRTFREVLLDDPDFDDLRMQIWTELELPDFGSIEYHIWKLERVIDSPLTPVSELAKLYKILGEFRGWIAKPTEKTPGSVTINNTVGMSREAIRVMSDADAERAYQSWLAAR
jgi:hypothetical protein